MCSYKSNSGWLVIDKIGDFLFFKDRYEMAKYFDMDVIKISGIITYCKRRICFYHKSGIYIQRLFTDGLCKRDINEENTEWDLSNQNQHFIDWIKIKAGHTENKYISYKYNNR